MPDHGLRPQSEQGALVRHGHPRMRLLHARALRRPHLARGRHDRVQPDDRDLAHARRRGRVLRQVGRHGDLPMGRHLVLRADAARRDPRPDDVQRWRTRVDLLGDRDVRVAGHDEIGPLDRHQREGARVRSRLANDGVTRTQDPAATRAAERDRAGTGLRRLCRRVLRRGRGRPDVPRRGATARSPNISWACSSPWRIPGSPRTHT